MTEWISVKEKLPDNYKPYLCILESNDYCNEHRWCNVLFYDFNVNKWSHHDVSCCYENDIEYLTSWYKVTHWMKLPPLPKEQT